MAESTVEMACFDCSPRDDRSNIGEDIAHGSIEDKTVDWFVEGFGAEESEGNESRSHQGQERSNTLNSAKIKQLRRGNIAGLHLGGG